MDDANRRILTKKFELGLFERPFADRSYAATVGSAAHRALARQAVRQSQVLLRNRDDLLPPAKTGGRIFVAGRSADDIGNQSGGWTLSWQGSSGRTGPGTTILQGIRDAVGDGTTVTFDRDGIGVDRSYRRGAGVPLIVVLVSGRPLDIADQLDGWDALLAAWLPGSEGAGVADVLFGDHPPTGRLPVTWMRSAGQQPINDGDGKPALFPYGFGLSYAAR